MARTTPASIEERALLRWPRLDRTALRRCHHDPDRIARLISRRTNLPMEAIRSVLVMPSVSDDEIDTWFG
jgi:hypothetical protein